MMSLSAVGSGSDAAGYYQKDNYYTRDQASEASGWQGKAADVLGLKGPVDEKQFADLLDGKLPNGAEIKSPSGEHRAGWDITLSAPKSVSLLALVGGDKRVEGAMRESAEATMAWVEKNLIETRIWDKEAGQQVTVRSDNIAVASFIHDVNRNNEPQLHVHNVIANATLAPDGKWHAIRNESFYDNQHLIGSIHSADLRARIEALGYETVPSNRAIDGNFEIAGVGRDTIEAFSSRLEEINEHVAANGYNSAEARQLAALATRSPKDPNLSRDKVVARWHESAKQTGFDPKPLIEASMARQAASHTMWTRAAEGLRSIGAVGMAFAARMGLTPKDGDPLVPERMGRLDPVDFAAAQATASAVRELHEREAAFGRNEVLEKALQHYGPFTIEHIEARIDLLVDKKLLIAGERLMTSTGAIALEQRVIAAAREGNGGAMPIATGIDLASRLQVAASEQGLRRLNEGQVKAGIEVLTGTNRVHLVQGGAGVGKSAVLGPVATVARAEGHKVFALSHVGRMAREFGEKLGEKGMTVDRFLGTYNGVLTGKASPDRVADRVTITREGARQLRGYRQGRIVAFSSNLKVQGFEKGERGQVVDVKDGKVELLMKDGELRAFDPARLPRNLSSDAVTIFEEKQIALHEGDRIRWTASDNARDFRNGDIGHVRDLSADGFTVETRQGQTHRIDRYDQMNDRLDLAYAINVHVAQGISEKFGIALMTAREKLLNTGQAFLSAVTRFAEEVIVVVDDLARIERDVTRNPGGKTSAIEETHGVSGYRQTAEPTAPSEHQRPPEPAHRDFGQGQDQPEIEPMVEPSIEPSRDFDIDM